MSGHPPFGCTGLGCVFDCLAAETKSPGECQGLMGLAFQPVMRLGVPITAMVIAITISWFRSRTGIMEPLA